MERLSSGKCPVMAGGNRGGEKAVVGEGKRRNILFYEADNNGVFQTFLKEFEV